MRIRLWLSPGSFVATLFLSAFGNVQTVSAQTGMPCHVMEMRDQTPPDQLPPPCRMTGIGNAELQITANPEAQMWFNQGLNLLHDFWDYESARAFEQSIRVDPNCAMCYWGLFQAESFYHSLAKDYAREALDTAVRLKGRASKRERLYIEATVASEDARRKAKPGSSPSDVRDLWRKLAERYPDDTQARISLARSVDHEQELKILESVLKDKPDDSAANHYYIHAVEGTDHPERALQSAEILARLAPASGHMVHMPGHIFFRIGDYSRAEQASAESMQVDERYMREQHVEPDNNWNYVHNLMYAVANLMEEGKLAQATALSSKLGGARGMLESTLYIYSVRDSIARIDAGLPVALRTGNWSEVLKLLQGRTPDKKQPHLQFLAGQLTRFAGGMQAIEAHDLAGAQRFSDQLDAELWRMSQVEKDSHRPATKKDEHKHKLEVLPDAMLQPLLSHLSVMSLELRASLLTARGNMAEANRLFLDAAGEEKALGYHEPPNYIRPVAETEAAAMMAAGHWTDAKAAYKRALLERPRSGFALFGIAISSEKSGHVQDAAKEYAEFLDAWKNADPVLPQVRYAHAFVASFNASQPDAPSGTSAGHRAAAQRTSRNRRA